MVDVFKYRTCSLLRVVVRSEDEDEQPKEYFGQFVTQIGVQRASPGFNPDTGSIWFRSFPNEKAAREEDYSDTQDITIEAETILEIEKLID